MANFFKKEDSLLTSNNCSLLLVDYQPQMLSTIKSAESQVLVNNALALTKTAKLFKMPTILSCLAQNNFTGNVLLPLQKNLPHLYNADRAVINAWDDNHIQETIRKTKREKLVVAGLWTEVCVTFPVIKALESGYTVYVVVDACGGISQLSHKTAIKRMVQAGAIPITWVQLLMELYRDNNQSDIDQEVFSILAEHAGLHGLDVVNPKTMTIHTHIVEEPTFVI